MKLHSAIKVIVGAGEDGAPVLRPATVCKVHADGTINANVFTEGKPEMDAGVAAELVARGERRVASLFLTGIAPGTGIGCVHVPPAPVPVVELGAPVEVAPEVADVVEPTEKPSKRAK